jgi:hypothetical protein
MFTVVPAHGFVPVGASGDPSGNGVELCELSSPESSPPPVPASAESTTGAAEDALPEEKVVEAFVTQQNATRELPEDELPWPPSMFELEHAGTNPSEATSVKGTLRRRDRCFSAVWLDNVVFKTLKSSRFQCFEA